MPTTFTITEEDYIKSALLNGELTRKTKIVHLVIDLLLVAAGFISFIRGDASLAYIFIGTAVGAVTAPYLVRLTLTPWLLKRHYKKYRQIQRPIDAQLTTEGMFYSTDAGSALLKWADIFSWRESRDYILIYVAPKMYHVLPTRLTDNGFPIDKLKSELLNHVGVAT